MPYALRYQMNRRLTMARVPARRHYRLQPSAVRALSDACRCEFAVAADPEQLERAASVGNVKAAHASELKDMSRSGIEPLGAQKRIAAARELPERATFRFSSAVDH
jgi:hypothetical protein